MFLVDGSSRSGRTRNANGLHTSPLHPCACCTRVIPVPILQTSPPSATAPARIARSRGEDEGGEGEGGEGGGEQHRARDHRRLRPRAPPARFQKRAKPTALCRSTACLRLLVVCARVAIGRSATILALVASMRARPSARQQQRGRGCGPCGPRLRPRLRSAERHLCAAVPWPSPSRAAAPKRCAPHVRLILCE